MTKARSRWNRVFWGVEFTGSRGDSFLIGSAWHQAANEANKGYPSEPTRALLFQSRKFARAFCWDRIAENKRTGGVCAKWKYRPVRVRERVTIT